MEVILASASPRRRELMKLFSLPYRVCAADVDETADPGLTPGQAVADISRRKAEAVARTPEDVVIGADTVVVCDGRLLGKPVSAADARQMLTALSGRSHQVITGVTVLRGERKVSRTETTEVYFRELTAEEIDGYIRTGEPMDKAGAYGIQGGGALFVQRICGDYYNVVGLPVCMLGQILRELAPELMEGNR